MHIDRSRQLSLLGAFVVLFAGLALGNPGFFAAGNLSDILINSSTLAIAALGMTLVIITGQIDISIGAILAICSTAAGLAAKAGLPNPVVLLIAVGTGGLLGLLNGGLCVLLRIHSIVITLGTLSIYRGLLLNGTQGAWIYELPPPFLAIGQGRLVGLPNPVAVMLLVYLLGWFALRWTRWGRNLFAVGSNTDVARLSGIAVSRMHISTFFVSGCLVGLAALLQASRFNVIQSNTGRGFEFPVITAVIVGGTSIFGGTGSVLGTLLGALFVTTTSTALIFLHVSGLWEQAVQGLLLLPAVVLDTLRLRHRRRRVRRMEAT